jgi:hypothetical protein
MIRRHILHIVTVGAAVTLAAAPGAAPPPPVTLRAFLAPTVTLTDAEMAAIDRGRPLGKVLPPRSGAEIFVLGIVHIKAPAAAYIARALDPSQLMIMPGYRGTGIIRDPPSIADLGGFTLEPDDLEELADCRPADCAVQFPASVIQDLRAAARLPNPATAVAQANHRVRQMAVDLVSDYRVRGNAALPIFNDESRPADVGEQFRGIMERFTALDLAPPEVTQLMIGYPYAVPRVPELGSVFYWEKVDFGLKPTLRLTHAMAYRPAEATGLGCVVAIKQLYSSHYMRAAIDYTACLTADRDGRPGFYLLAVKGSRQEGITGFAGSLIRRIVVSRTRTALDGSLIRLKNALEVGR